MLRLKYNLAYRFFFIRWQIRIGEILLLPYFYSRPASPKNIPFGFKNIVFHFNIEMKILKSFLMLLQIEAFK